LGSADLTPVLGVADNPNILLGQASQGVALAQAKKPEHCHDYDNETNNVDESIHLVPSVS